MATILISNKTFSEQAFQDKFGESLQELDAFGKDGLMWSNHFYTLGETSSHERSIINSLNINCGGKKHNLYDLCETLGEDTAIGVSKTTMMLRDSLIAASGASVGLFTARSNKFVLAVGEYQTALKEFHEEIRVNKGSGGKNSKVAQNVKTASDTLNENFRHELDLANRGKSGRNRARSPLNNYERAKRIARSSRHIKKLELVNSIEANALGQFSNKAKIIAPGIIVLDLGVRAYDVNNVREEGGDWERAAFVESFGFAASAGAGVLGIKAAAAIFLTMTPVGWVAIIVATAGASLLANDAGKAGGNYLYDLYEKMEKFMDSK